MSAGLRHAAAVLAVLALTACHHGGGGDQPAAGPDATVSGTVTFDLVPTANIGGVWQLDYANTRSAPGRGLTVQILRSGSVVASTTTDANGAYSLTTASNQNIVVRARAEMIRTGAPSWTVGVTDNTQGDGLWVEDSATFLLAASGATQDLHAASGWNGAGYDAATRDAAPFAILDTLYDTMQFVLASEPSLTFPTLTVHWSPNNLPTVSTTGPLASTGQIGSSQYRSGGDIYLLGAQDTDTDEYDRSVIAALWGEYLVDAFGRDDSVTGPHVPGDQLDMRLAFRDGFGTAFSAMVAGDPAYINTQGTHQAQSVSFNVEDDSATAPNPAPGWFSERSIHELIYNLYDANANALPAGSATQDNVTLAFGPLFSALTALKTTAAQTSLFPFIHALQTAEPSAQADIDALVRTEGMDSVVDDYGSTETHFGTPATPKLVSVYDSVVVNGGATNICSVDDFKSSASGSIDKLGSRRYARFSVATAGTYTLRATAVTPPAAADPDLVLHQVGGVGASTTGPSAACTQSWQTTVGVCAETLNSTLSPGDYTLEVYEWTNTTDDPRYPSIGEVCFDVTVTGP
ncbi:MAG: hypothetical protein ABI640_17610 [Gammaproteobacteria bacterium]